jgi:serine/threonine-protein kinase
VTESKAPPIFAGYELLGMIGEGGVGKVYLARSQAHPEYGEVALKVLREDRGKDPRYVDFFSTEADIACLVQHDNLVRTFEAGEAMGRYFIAMERILGRDLELTARRCRELKAPIPPDFSFYVVAEMLAGLAALHAAKSPSGEPFGIVHRDVTPQNIFVAYSGRIVLGDFGIAHIGAYGRPDANQTMGKLGYLAPEQASFSDEVDQRADLFAAGICLWELLTGQRLFQAASKEMEEEVLRNIARAKIPRPSKVNPTVPREMEDVVMHALGRRPEDRFQNALEMRAALSAHFSDRIAHPRSIEALMAGLFREDLATLAR